MARKHVEDWIYDFLDKLTHTNLNSTLLKEQVISKLKTDKQFSDWIDDLVSGKKKITITVPPGTDTKLDIATCKKMGKSIGHDFYQYLTIGSTDDDIPPYRTNEKYMIVDQSIMRLQQFSASALKHSEDDTSVDNLTKQPTGSSEGSSVTHPETQILAGGGFKNVLLEVLKTRGGDAGEFRALGASLASRGSADLKELEQYGTGVGSTKLVDVYLKAMHVKMS